MDALKLERTQVGPNHYAIGNNWIKKDTFGLYEVYLEGKPFDRGVIYGKLAKELLSKQEDYFVDQIKELVPSPYYMRFLKYLIGWFNRNLDESIPLENRLEIYGESFSAPKKYEYISPSYQRMLNYHAAHDIGHALADKGMVVGCSSFGEWNEFTMDSSLILGRNFDFYVGDSFARDKIIMFVKPDEGLPFMQVSWGGMMGTVSGMNHAGLTVTLNAAKSDYPTASATPISIVARQILQYATTIDEAFAIAKKYKTFVSESILVGSAKDHRAAIIEKTPTQTFLYESDRDRIICTNHFQSDSLKNDPNNLKHRENSSTNYRYARMTELLDANQPLDVPHAVDIMRNYNGMNGLSIGLGNEDALNQFIAHHSIIFEPEQQLVWVSSNPVPFNSYAAYDLNRVFDQGFDPKTTFEVPVDSLTIPADTFLTRGHYNDWLQYRALKTQIYSFIAGKHMSLTPEIEVAFMRSNSDYYETFQVLGDYYRAFGMKDHAIDFYKTALEKDIPLLPVRKEIEQTIAKLQEEQP